MLTAVCLHDFIYCTDRKGASFLWEKIKMKKLLTIVTIFALFLSLTTPAFAKSDDYPYLASATVTLAFRDKDGNFLENLPANDTFTVLYRDPRDSSRVWIDWNGKKGSVIETGIQKANVNWDYSSDLQYSEAFTECGLNLRNEETSELIQVIPQGEIVTILRIDNYHTDRVIVDWNGIEGSVIKSGLFVPQNSDYILVDIDAQTVYMYVDGEQIVSAYVVTGAKNSHDTPRGFFQICAMEENVTLRGADYSCPVRYWMPFYNGCGLHDASWRDSFGGNIYEWDGSHGCVNMRLDTVQTIFENAYVGMPVIVF